MKRAFSISLEDYYKKLDEIQKIEYNYGYQCDPSHCQYRLSSSIPERTKKRYEKLKSEIDYMPKPESKIFFRNTDLYNLWLNRDTDEPVTAKELYNIVAEIGEAIGTVRSAAIWDTFLNY